MEFSSHTNLNHSSNVLSRNFNNSTQLWAFISWKQLLQMFHWPFFSCYLMLERRKLSRHILWTIKYCNTASQLKCIQIMCQEHGIVQLRSCMSLMSFAYTEYYKLYIYYGYFAWQLPLVCLFTNNLWNQQREQISKINTRNATGLQFFRWSWERSV